MIDFQLCKFLGGLLEFFYRDQTLCIGQKIGPEIGPEIGKNSSRPLASEVELQFIQLEKFVKKQKSPCYLYDLEQIEERIQFFKKSLSFIKSQNIHFAVKSNHNKNILAAIAKQSLGADTVSIGEIKRAIESGFEAKNIIFSGVGKTADEISQALDLKIKQINIESRSELLRIIKICADKKKSIEIGIRLNPRVSPVTHKSISTGGADHKFGVDLSEIEDVKKALIQNPEFVQLKSLSMHIGSNFLRLAELKEAISILAKHFDEFQKDGFALSRLDLGGGLGIDYFDYDLRKDEALINEYAKILAELHKQIPHVQLMLEPGRILVARGGILLTQIQYLKKNGSTDFAVVDTGMNHLMRPALYEAHHQIWPLIQRNEVSKVYTVVGPICESTDVLATNVELVIHEDDYLAILDCGAYGMSMSSHYNLHDFPHEYFYKNGQISHLV
jgi:diaminopimelate decarboxylase